MKSIPTRHFKKTQKEPETFGSFSIRDIKEILDGKDMFQALHRHDFFFILVLKKGCGHHEIDFTNYEVGNHSVTLMRPGQVHQLTLKAGSEGYLIEFENDFFYDHNKLSQRLLHKVSSKNFNKLDINTFKKLDQVLIYISNEFRDKAEGYQEVIISGLSIVFIELTRHQHSLQSDDHIKLYSQEQLEKLLELLETHIAVQKHVSQYADMMNLSTYQLNTITKKSLNKTPSELINEHIVLEAKRYLLATSSQINQIADELGYEDVSYFIRFFKKHTGHSPEAFRNNFR